MSCSSPSPKKNISSPNKPPRQNSSGKKRANNSFLSPKCVNNNVENDNMNSDFEVGKNMRFDQYQRVLIPLQETCTNIQCFSPQKLSVLPSIIEEVTPLATLDTRSSINSLHHPTNQMPEFEKCVTIEALEEHDQPEPQHELAEPKFDDKQMQSLQDGQDNHKNNEEITESVRKSLMINTSISVQCEKDLSSTKSANENLMLEPNKEDKSISRSESACSLTLIKSGDFTPEFAHLNNNKGIVYEVRTIPTFS